MNVVQIFENEYNSQDIKKNLLKLINEELDPYERLKGMFLTEWYLLKQGEDNFFKGDILQNIDEFKEASIKYPEANKELLQSEVSHNSIITTIANMFKFGKIIRITSEINELAFNTSNIIKPRRLPHNIVFITSLIKNILPQVDILGIALDMRFIVNDGSISLEEMYYGSTESLEKHKDRLYVEEKLTNKIIIFGIDHRDKSSFYIKDTISQKGFGTVDDYKSESLGGFVNEEHKLIKERSAIFAYNIIDLINHPEIEIIKTSNEYLRNKRISEGRLGVPDIIDINLTGKLKRYVSETLPKQKNLANNFSHKFWVRGHFITFKHERYKEARGKTKWIMPFIKGTGELVSKNYSIGKEDIWKHQQLMISIVKSIFPDKKVMCNCRTVLNGLEIDCYLPELKLGFEYNGQQHYEWIREFHKEEKEFLEQKSRDIEKNLLASKRGIKLITIKYNEVLTEELISNKIKEANNGTTI